MTTRLKLIARRAGLAVVLGLFVSWVSPHCLVAQQNTTSAQDFEQRLEKLGELLESERVKNKIPGLALAVVKDGEVVFSQGFGHSNLAEQKPVDEETLFAIGSSTKSFTSTLVAMLVDQGKMDWDDPVTKYLPDFQMDVDTGDEVITIGDLLSHRTGFTRMGLIWASGSKSRAEVIQTAAQAKAYAKFQEKFLYNNVMYMTAGVCAGRAMDSDWDTLVADRIFKPLGMDASSTTIRVAQNDQRLSLGYMWDKDNQEFIHLPMRNLDSIGPSGSINSNVKDMAKWIQFQLDHGKVGDNELMTQASQEKTWSKQMEIAGGVNYGFGWMLREWNGKKVVEHGGNIDGFGAQVTLLPELNAGYVLLTNVTATPLQGSSVGLVFDTLFGETEEEGSLEGVDMTELVGDYKANFGPFDDATMAVKMKDGNLAIDVPGQMLFELKNPDDDGKWFFAVTDTVAVSFNRNDDGKVISLTMHQSGMTPEFLRDDYEPKPESSHQVTAPLVGKYRDEENDVDVEVGVRKGRLVINTGGKGVFCFLPPNEDGVWRLRARPEMLQVRFNADDDGKIKSVTRIQGGKEVEMMRADDGPNVATVTAEELLAKVQKAAGAFRDAELQGVRLKGTTQFVHQGVTGTYERVFAVDGRHWTRQHFGKMATIVESFDGEHGVTDTSIGRREDLIGKKLNSMKMQHPLWLSLDWQEFYTEAEVVGEQKVDGQQTLVLALRGDDVFDRKLYVVPESGAVLKEDSVVPHDIIGEMKLSVSFSDFRDVGGVQMPFRMESENPMVGALVIQIESFEPLEELKGSLFEVPPRTP